MTNHSLLDALRIDTFNDRRKALRDLATPTLADNMTSIGVRDIFDASPLVGTASDQINPRPTVSGLRDSLDEDTLCALIDGRITAADVCTAIHYPASHAERSTTSKTGYAFGRPAGIVSAQQTYNDLATTQEPTMGYNIADFGLQDYIDIHDHCVSEGHDSEDVLDAMVTAIDAPALTINGIQAMLNARTQGPESKDLAKFAQMAADDVLKHLDGEVTEAPAPSAIYNPPADTQLIDLALSQAGLPPIGKLIGELNDATEKAKAASLSAIPQVVEASVGDDIPTGRVKTAKAKDVFGIKGVAAQSFDFDVPVWEWDAPHPHVPSKDADYVFRGTDLLRVLYSILSNKRTYLHGHSGSGKTTLVEQVAAFLGWPFMRVNFDSEITRMDLIGRDTLVQEGGTTVSKFVDGILPQMLSGPYIACFDELDFVRPDVAYVMQRVFEGNGLMLTEDGGRIVKPHRMFRMFATGNTVGQGDEFGMYQGARPQSMAMLDRFTVWAHIDYLNEAERKRLITKRVPSLAKDMLDKVNKYVTEHIEAFKTSKVMQPITPRGYLDMAEAIVMFTQVFPASKQSKAVEEAVAMTVLDRASVQDRAVLTGIVNRVFN
jgi:cobaltochelatase CobS